MRKGTEKTYVVVYRKRGNTLATQHHIHVNATSKAKAIEVAKQYIDVKANTILYAEIAIGMVNVVNKVKVVEEPTTVEPTTPAKQVPQNYKRIEKRCNKYGFRIGCYDDQLNKLSENNLRRVLAAIEYSTDTKVMLHNKPYIAELDEVDGEIDIKLTPLKEYESRFGKWEEW